MSNSSESQSKGITFTFSKKSKQNSIDLNKIKSEFIQNNDSKNQKTDFVTSIDDKQIQSCVQIINKKELIIPLITNNRYRVKNDINKELKTQSINNNINNNESNGNNNNGVNEEKQTNYSLEDMAKRELLREANKWKDNNETEIQSSRVIPVIDSLIQNRVPEGFESDEKFDVSLRPIEPTLDDYESVPIQEFGLAMLRGMGWKPGQSIGRRNHEVYIPVEPKVRPKGLGLGAESSLKQQISKISKNIAEEELQLKKGSFVSIEFGAHVGSYGVIEDFDDDMSRVTVKLSLKKESIKIPVALLRVVTKKEFQTEGNVINKAKYEEYIKQEKSVKNEEIEQKSSSQSKDRHEKDRNSKRKHTDSKTSDSVPKQDIKCEDNDKVFHKKQLTHNSWLLPNLRVRIIDKNYKNGKYYKEKVVIKDVLNQTKCCCKTDDKKLLEDIDYKMLETVIPRNNNSNVKVLFGKYKKELGLIIDRNKSRNEANVQLLSDKRKILTLSYDEICEISE